MPDKRAPEMRFRSELYLGKKVTKIIKFIKNVDLVVHAIEYSGEPRPYT